MRLKLIGLAAATGVAAFAFAGTPAQALVIDFTDISVWGVGNIIAPPNLDNQVGTASYLYPDSLTVTLTATGGNLTFNVPGSCGTAGFLACDGDGIGINDDEISGVLSAGESLLVEFSHAVSVYTVSLLDLFARDLDNEIAIMQFDGSTSTFAAAGIAPDDHVGFLQVTPNIGTVTSILFTAPDATSDFALAALEINVDVISQQVPEPMTASLFGLGLLSLALTMRAQPTLARRRRRG